MTLCTLKRPGIYTPLFGPLLGRFVARLTCIWEIPSSNLGRGIDFPDRDFLSSPQLEAA